MKKDFTEHIQNILSTLSLGPGVYQMKDIAGRVLYVGKAKNLKKRVSSYFERTHTLSPAKRQMVQKITDIEVILCRTEVEALVLETNLIKHLSPKYNILMKDDKNLAYIKITNSPVPEVVKTRQKIKDGALYFGPYTSSVEHAIRVMRRIFKIRSCRMKFAGLEGLSSIKITDKSGKTIPCMDYYIGLCSGPCLLKDESLRSHSESINLITEFLQGNTHDVYAQLHENMLRYASIHEFEKAQDIKESIESLKVLHEKQSVRDFIDGDADIFIKYEKYDKVFIGISKIRGGNTVGVFRYEVDIGIAEEDEIAVNFLMRHYIDNNDLPDVLIVSNDIKDSSFHTFLTNMKIVIDIPKIGPKRELLDFTLNQVREYAYKKEMERLEKRALNKEHMKQVLSSLGYPFPQKGDIIFECYDISHTDGHFTYASRVVIVNGKPDTSRYKKYKIKSIIDGQIDDFASHKEVMMRRTLEGIEQENFPHLIIIDGGKGQLSSALMGIQLGKDEYKNQHEDYFDVNIPICSIAKREEEIFLPKRIDPVIFEKGSPELMVIQKARDESHRFSITANKSARMKSMKKNILEEIPGIGPITRKKLLKAAGSIEGIQSLSGEQMTHLCTPRQVRILQDHGIY